MKSKTKTKKTKVSQTKTVRTSRPRVQKYPPHYLAIALSAVLLFEGIAIGSTTSADWKQAAAILDMSGAVHTTISDTVQMFAPMIEMADNINEFYVVAANEMTALLDVSEGFGDVTLAVEGINEFYVQASMEMASLLDASGSMPWVGQVAGLSIENN